MILACQEQHLPGADLAEKWRFAVEAGFDGIELLGRDDFASRLDELRAAREAGAVFPSVCVNGGPFIGDFARDDRRRAVGRMRDLLSTIAAVDGGGAVTPAAYGIFSRVLPPYTPRRSEDEDRRVLLETLGELSQHAEQVGADLYLEPLNRYEDHMLNRLEQAVELCEAVGSRRLRVMADTYHMNIEESDLAAAILAAGGHVAHVHVSDSNRLEPGAGHVDFAGVLRALRDVGFDGTLAFEGRLSGPAETVLPALARRIRSLWQAATAAERPPG